MKGLAEWEPVVVVGHKRVVYDESIGAYGVPIPVQETEICTKLVHDSRAKMRTLAKSTKTGCPLTSPPL